MEQVANKKGPFLKDRLIEDWLDINFYHPLGYHIAVFLNRFNFSPNAVSFISMIFGVCGSVLIYFAMPVIGSLFIVFAGILDSSDGQIARITRKTSVYGRIIDGLVGYVIFASVYIAIALKYESFIPMVLAGISNGIHSSIYDFYRTAYLSVTGKKYMDFFPPSSAGPISKIYSFYTSYQSKICRYHISFIRKLISEKKDLSEKEIDIYKKRMLSNIQFINLLGDNWKINGILFFSLINRLDIFFYYIIFIINAVFIFVVLRQKQIDLDINSEVI